MSIKVTWTFAPTEAYPRHSEGAFERVNDREIVFFYCRFHGGRGDNAACDLARCVSRNEGESWSEPETVLNASLFGTENVMSVSLIRMLNGDLGCVYLVKQTPAYNRIFLSRSRDGGKTFYRHTECTLPGREAWYVINNDRIERLSGGRLLIPVTFHRGGFGRDAYSFFDARGAACFLISDDDGETWHESADMVYPPFTNTRWGLQENGAVELRPGVLMGYSRTDKYCQYEYFSFDGGEHWTPAQPSRFTSPCSPMRIKRRPGTSELYAVWNPIPNYQGRVLTPSANDRTPLVYAVSRDEGRSWSTPAVIEGQEDHGYCYPALFFTKDNCLLVSYCAGGEEDGNILSRTNIARITL